YYDVIHENDTTYVGYYGNPSGSNRFDAYLQKINADGSLPYGTDGSGFAPGFSGNNDPYEQTINIAKKPGAGNVWAVCTITNSLQTTSGVYIQKFDAASGSDQYGTEAKEVLPMSSKLNSLAFSQLSLCDNSPVFLVTNVSNKLAAVKINEADGSTAYVTPLATSSNTKFRYGFTNFYKGQAVAVWQENKGNDDWPYAQNIRCGGSTGPASGFESSPIAEAAISIKSIYPNPVQNNLMATITSSTQSNVHIYITDVSGNVMKQFQQNVQKGNTVITVNVSNIKPGSCFIKVVNETASAASMFDKQ
ncbi:MAG: T9SS type A sorting domain-containing protein, partial [Parafilimonas sp.]